MTALEDMRAGRDPPPVPTDLLTAAVWSAARHGLDDDFFDVRCGRRRRVGDVVVDLLERIEPALACSGDQEHIGKLTERLLREGNGAARQREVVRHAGFPALVEFVTAETTATWP